MKNGYKGSPSLETSSANHQVIPLGDPTWTEPRYTFYSFSFENDQQCHVVINNETIAYLRAGQGFNSDTNSAPY